MCWECSKSKELPCTVPRTLRGGCMPSPSSKKPTVLRTLCASWDSGTWSSQSTTIVAHCPHKAQTLPKHGAYSLDEHNATWSHDSQKQNIKIKTNTVIKWERKKHEQQRNILRWVCSAHSVFGQLHCIGFPAVRTVGRSPGGLRLAEPWCEAGLACLNVAALTTILRVGERHWRTDTLHCSVLFVPASREGRQG